MQPFLHWLNANAGALTTLATIVLAVMTGIYIRQNGKIITAMRDQLDLALRVHEQDRSDLQEALHADVAALRAHAGRLLGTLSELPQREPQEDQLRRSALWTSEDLNELQRLARSSRVGVHAAADAARHLAAIAKLGRRVDQVNPSHGFGFGQRDKEAWARDVAGATEALKLLAGTRLPVQLGDATAPGGSPPAG